MKATTSPNVSIAFKLVGVFCSFRVCAVCDESLDFAECFDRLEAGPWWKCHVLSQSLHSHLLDEHSYAFSVPRQTDTQASRSSFARFNDRFDLFQIHIKTQFVSKLLAVILSIRSRQFLRNHSVG